MRTTTFLCLLALLLTTAAHAQSKSELQATITSLTAKNDSLAKLHGADMNLLDSLQHLTGVKVTNLDTVKSVLASRQMARTNMSDSLSKSTARAGALQHKADSLSKQNIFLHGEVDSLHTVIAALKSAIPAAGGAPPTSSGTSAAGSGGASELLKLNGMLEQGLITKDEFLKLKAELMKK